MSSVANRASSGVRAALSPAGKPEVAETFSSTWVKLEDDALETVPCNNPV